MIVAKITAQKAQEIMGVEAPCGRFYNPVQDLNENWVISMAEATHLTDYEEIEWEAPLINEEDV